MIFVPVTLSPMKCLECREEFELKRSTAQFCSPNCRVAYNRKKKDGSKPKTVSHVVALKQRTIERIRKAQGPSSTQKTELPQGPDVPPAEDFVRYKHPFGKEPLPEGMGFNYQKPPAMVWDGVTWNKEGATEKEIEANHNSLLNTWASLSGTLEDATAGLPPEALPESQKWKNEATHPCDVIDPMSGDGLKILTAVVNSGYGRTVPSSTFLEHHGTENDLARQVLSKVPVPKLDPNSEEAELARLQKSQLRTTKKKES